MADTATAVAAPAAAASSTPASPGNSVHPADSIYRPPAGPLKTDLGSEFDEGLDNPNPVNGNQNGSETVAGKPDPAVAGESVSTAKPDTQPKPEGEVDVIQQALDYANGLAPKPHETPDPNVVNPSQQQQPGATPPISDFIKANEVKLKDALKAAGMDERAVAELLNAPTLAGRHSAEIGQLRKDNQAFAGFMKHMAPVMDFDANTKAPIGINGLKVLQEISRKDGGPAEVQRQLATVGLKLVPANSVLAPSDNGIAQARTEIMAVVAKDFGINPEGLTPAELRAEIKANAEADDAFQQRIGEWQYNQRQANEIKTRQAEQQRQQQNQQTEAQRAEEARQVSALVDDYRAKIPHFAEIEPVMASLYQKYFGQGAPNNVAITELLRHVAENMTSGPRWSKLIPLIAKRERANVLKQLGIPESELTDAAPSNQGGASQDTETNPPAKHKGGYVDEFVR